MTSDGYVMCDFENANGERHMGAFVGSYTEIKSNIFAVCDGLDLTPRERLEALTLLDNWVGRTV